MMEKEEVKIKSSVVLREEFDDWAILFDPDSNISFGINPIGVYVWKRLEKGCSLTEIISSLNDDCEDVPEDIEGHISEFIDSLISRGLAE
ncbi:SynChlorMet cassette protein ScmD [Thermodesulfobacteriota bacterium]